MDDFLFIHILYQETMAPTHIQLWHHRKAIYYVNVAFLFRILNSRPLWSLHSHLKMTWYWDKVVEYWKFYFYFNLLCISFCILLYWVCIFVNWNPFCEHLNYMRQKDNFVWKTVFLRISNHNKCLQIHFFSGNINSFLIMLTFNVNKCLWQKKWSN